jgi:hypothetical protein
MAINQSQSLRANSARRDLHKIGVILIVASACAFDTAAYAQQRGEDIWGKGNDFSNAQGGVSASPLPPVPAGKVPNTPAWKAVCNEHFRNIDSDNRRERERIERRLSNATERDKAWKDYVERRNRQSTACADTWPGEFDLARARNDIDTARGSDDAAACSIHAIPVPSACRDYIVSMRIAKRGQGAYQSRFDVEGNLYVPPGEAVGITFLDGSFQSVASASRMDVAPVCIRLSQEAQSRGLRPGTLEWRTWAEGKVREWRSGGSGSSQGATCAFAGRG